MELKQVVAHLTRIPLFSELTDEQGEIELYHVAKIVNEATLEKGEWLFGQGQNSDRLYYILEGSLHLTQFDPDGVKHEIGIREAGSVMGVTGLLVGDFHDVTAEALTPVKFLYIIGTEFMELYHTRPRLRSHLNVRRDLAQRLRLPKFSWLRKDEWPVFVVQRHIARFVRKAAPPLLLFAILMIFFSMMLASGTPTAQLVALIMAFPLIGLVALVGWHYLNWRDDFFVLTTQRVVHIERVVLFREHFEESFLEKVEDIYEVRAGFVSNVLNYGNLVLQTAGETVEIDMNYVANPGYLSELISREIERARVRDVLSAQGAIRDVLAQRLKIKESPALEPIPEPQERESPAPLVLLAGGLRDYFFPPSWTVSPDGNTIVWRRFWLPGFIHYLRVFLPLLALTLGGGYFLLVNWGGAGMVWLFAGWLLVEAILFAMLLWYIEDWRNDYFQLTPARLILVNRKPLLMQESRREAPLDRIQNISFDIPGILGRLFRYGHVTLETAGTMGKFELRYLRDPQLVQSEISKRQRDYNQQQKKAEVERRREELLSWFSMYDNLRDEKRAAEAAQSGNASAD
ncbi:MAG: cyclic nucleotide-binding domain-containing protein [Anaerolineae bacterium]|nr:cyclic nucleotide-binding domain-containing protein [Anaerolineae bacterium]